MGQVMTEKTAQQQCPPSTTDGNWRPEGAAARPFHSRRRQTSRASRWGLWLALVGLVAGGCTDANLYHLQNLPNLPNKIAFTGRVCTDNPAERRFPLKVVFLVDASANLPLEPNNVQGRSDLVVQRVNAVRDAVNVLRGDDTEFALVRFGGDAVAAPDGSVFTANTSVISEAAGALTQPMPCTGDGCVRTSQALSIADSLITGDLLSTARGPRSRTSYLVVLVQSNPVDDNLLDGQTNADCDHICTLQNRVEAMRNFVLDNGAADFRFHAVDVGVLSEDAAWRTATHDVLEPMATIGGGEYAPVCRRNEAGELTPATCGPFNLSLLGLDLRSARNVLVQRSFIISNLNVLHTNEGAVPDSDQDGIPDAAESNAGTDPQKRDTDDDGIGDKVESLLATVGLDPLNFDEPVQCAGIENPIVADTDGDGLTDCEERLLRMDPTLFDSDGDGIPDLIEFLADTNYLEDDVLDDKDFDGMLNGPEVRAHSDASSADTLTRAELSYYYREVNIGIREHRFSSQPRDISGVVVDAVSASTNLGNGLLGYIPGTPPLLAWRDPGGVSFGEGVRIDGDGTYTLPAACPAGVDCDAEEVPREITVDVTEGLLPPFPVDEFLRVDVAERECTDFRVRNVTLAETLAADGRRAGRNDIRVYFGQVPQATPDAFAIFRVAQFSYTHTTDPEAKEPNIADQPVESYHFVLFGD